MKITSLQLENYRNYETLHLSFHEKINIFLGENAQGKTNLLESLYVLAMTKSHRTNQEKELIFWEKDFARIQGEIEKKSTAFPIEIYFTAKGRKTKINHLEQKRLSEYIGQMNVILFAPEDLSLVKGSPSIRRKFLDMELSQIHPIYLHDLVEYHQNLKQRNRYMKQMASEKKELDVLYMDILEEQLAKSGANILFYRLRFLKQLESWASVVHEKISQKKEKLSFQYVSSVKLLEGENKEKFYEILKTSLLKNRAKDFFRQTTSIGPHRDDISFLINQVNVAIYGSQGQQRTTVLSVKLAEIDLIQEVIGEYPILLLDDVMSELDNERQIHLLEAIEGKTQTFITTTTLKHLEKLEVPAKIFSIHEGKLLSQEKK